MFLVHLPTSIMDPPPYSQVSSLLEDMSNVGKSYTQNEPGAREKLLSLAYSLAAVVELPSETIQRIGWAEVSCLEPGVGHRSC